MARARRARRRGARARRGAAAIRRRGASGGSRTGRSPLASAETAGARAAAAEGREYRQLRINIPMASRDHAGVPASTTTCAGRICQLRPENCGFQRVCWFAVRAAVAARAICEAACWRATIGPSWRRVRSWPPNRGGASAGAALARATGERRVSIAAAPRALSGDVAGVHERRADKPNLNPAPCRLPTTRVALIRQSHPSPHRLEGANFHAQPRPCAPRTTCDRLRPLQPPPARARGRRNSASS